jgi:Family of unknown function (DUF6127)
MDERRFEEMLERAAKRGAMEALESIGLHDDSAVHDVRELRGLLDAWRGAKKTVWKTMMQAMTMALLGALAAGTFIQLRGDGK